MTAVGVPYLDKLENEKATMSIVGLRGDRVRLVPPDRTLHLENALRWMNDPAITATIELNFGFTRREEELFYERVETRRDTELFWAILDETDRHIGFTVLTGIHWRHRTATGGLLIGERDAWCRGYATDAVRVRTRFGFDQMGLHRIEGHSFNPAMCRVYEKCGYKREGLVRQKIWRDGQWLDAALYAILESDYASLSRATPP
jgi:RimJ/RimL family protein N-acetyltransferase